MELLRESRTASELGAAYLVLLEAYLEATAPTAAEPESRSRGPDT